jgi:hypothetical protein
MEDLGYVDEGVEAEHSSLYDGDGNGRPEQRVLPLSEAVEGSEPADMSAFPGRW